ncbi:MAG: aldehyde dehydrogenase family protein [Phycisphaerales bacterium]|nr:aldehyde dehydrogenase family protein [Phycisphaerales bacterium]
MPDPARLDIQKTYKLYIGGAFPRSESGRSEPIRGADGSVLGHASKASRKDLRDAVTAARAGLSKWKSATAYNRGQVLYRMAEMLQGKRTEFIELLTSGGIGLRPLSAGAGLQPADEVNAAIERLVYFAGWCDKYAQVLGVQNHVAGPYWNLSTPEPTGVIGVVCPPDAPLLGLVTLIAPSICTGNAAVAISPAFAPVVSTFGEVCATSDLPAGVVNLLTGSADELAPVLAMHRDIDGITAVAGTLTPELTKVLKEGAADNLKRVRIFPAADLFDAAAWHHPGLLEATVETKTVWHPVGA